MSVLALPAFFAVVAAATIRHCSRHQSASAISSTQYSSVKAQSCSPVRPGGCLCCADLTWCTKPSSCDLETDGSPTTSTLMSPRIDPLVELPALQDSNPATSCSTRSVPCKCLVLKRAILACCILLFALDTQPACAAALWCGACLPLAVTDMTDISKLTHG